MASKRTVKEYMRSVLKEYTSPWMGEVNTTLLEEFFDWAFEVDKEWGG